MDLKDYALRPHTVILFHDAQGTPKRVGMYTHDENDELNKTTTYKLATATIKGEKYTFICQRVSHDEAVKSRRQTQDNMGLKRHRRCISKHTANLPTSITRVKVIRLD